jgi:hypothetical protein
MFRVPFEGVGARSGSSSTAAARTISVARGLHEQAVRERPIVGVRPELRLVFRFDQLRGDAHAIRFGPHRALEQVVRAKRCADFASGPIRALHAHGG